jgi:hypothetical protein
MRICYRRTAKYSAMLFFIPSLEMVFGPGNYAIPCRDIIWDAARRRSVQCNITVVAGRMKLSD